jgi:hypothetical protein
MSPKPVSNVAASVHQRLLNQAREANRPFNELLQYYSMERFLYRLSKSPYADKFVLKGALMLVAWQAPVTRPTMDIDFLGKLKNDPDAISRAMAEVCRVELPADGVVFDPSSITTTRIAQDANYAGVRVKVRGYLGNARLALQIDVGFGDAVVPKPAAVTYPTLLPFPAPKLRGYTRESAVAEKFEAMTKLGMLNSRIKDFYDIWLLAHQFDFKGAILAKAIRRTFETRGTLIDPKTVAFTKEFADDPAKKVQWRAFLRRNRLKDAPEELGEVVGFIANFLLPTALAPTEGPDFTAQWRAPGPWSSR